MVQIAMLSTDKIWNIFKKSAKWYALAQFSVVTVSLDSISIMIISKQANN